MTPRFIFYLLCFSVSFMLMLYQFMKRRSEQGATLFIITVLFYIGLSLQLSMNNGGFLIGQNPG